MSEPRRHVLIWVAPEFLKSSEAAGCFVTEANHGAGTWISPVNVPGLQLRILWHLVKSVVTAEGTQSSKALGLMSDLAQPKMVRKAV